MPLIVSSGSKLRGWTPPDAGSGLPVGEWTNVTPPVSDIASTFGFDWVERSATQAGLLVACCDQRGGWKTTTYGINNDWSLMGNPAIPFDPFSGVTAYLDSPVRMLFYPGSTTRMSATQGVRGDTLGYWKSTDGGNNWTMPANFRSLALGTTTIDVTTMVRNPGNPDELLLGSHSQWQGSVKAGVMRSTDDGDNWTATAAISSWPDGSHGIGFVKNSLGVFDGLCWIVATDGDGFWKTINAGVSYSQVSSSQRAVHHGSVIEYDSTGRLWAGSQPYLAYSDDDGDSWNSATSLEARTYYCGREFNGRIFTQISDTGDNATVPKSFMATSIASPNSFSAYAGGAQTFADGPFVMVADEAQKLLHAACWRTGVWVLREA